MRDKDGETQWVMADRYCLRSAVYADNGSGRMKDEEGKGQNGRILFYFLSKGVESRL